MNAEEWKIAIAALALLTFALVWGVSAAALTLVVRLREQECQTPDEP